MNFDWIAKTLEQLFNAPLPFLVGLAIGFSFGKFWTKREIENLRSSAESAEKRAKFWEDRARESEGKLEQSKNDILNLQEENNRLAGLSEKPKNPFFLEEEKYKNKLSSYTDVELGQEALSLCKKWMNELASARKRQQPWVDARQLGSHDTPLYNKWLKESERLLAVKHAILERLKKQMSDDELETLDVLLDSHYENKICTIESVQEAVEEVQRLGAKVKGIL